MTRRVLVTGATGFLGPHVLAALAARGDAAWGLARPGRSRVRDPAPKAGGAITWIEADLLDAESIARAVLSAEPDLVIHLAAAKSGAIDALRAVNVGGTERLLSALAGHPDAPRALRRSPRVLVIGSAAEYGAVPESALPIREDTALAPVSDYGRTKAEATARALALGRELGVPVAVVRVFNATGPGEPESLLFGHVALGIARAERERERAGAAGTTAAREIPVGSLGATRDLIDARDVARALLAIADRAEAGAVVNVGRGVEEPVRDHVARLVARARAPMRVAEPPGLPAPPPARHVAEVSRLASLGFRARVALEESAADLLDEARARVS